MFAPQQKQSSALRIYANFLVHVTTGKFKILSLVQPVELLDHPCDSQNSQDGSHNHGIKALPPFTHQDAC